MFGDPRFRTGSLFALTSVFFGGTFVAVKAGLAHFPPLLFAAFRFDLAALLLLGYVGWTRTDWRPRTTQDLIGVVVTGGLAIGVNNALLFVGQQYTTSAIAAIVYSLVPVLTPVFAAGLLADEHVSLVGGVGLAIGVLGVAFVVRPDATMLLGGGAVGKAVLLFGAASSALGSVLVRRLDTDSSSIVVTAWGLPVSAALLHATSRLAGESAVAVDWSVTALLALGYVGIFSGAIAYAAYFEVLDTLGAVRTNVVNYVIPVVAAVTGWLLLGEAISTLTAVGFVVIAVGFSLVERTAVRGAGRRLRATLAGTSEGRVLAGVHRVTDAALESRVASDDTNLIDVQHGDD